MLPELHDWLRLQHQPRLPRRAARLLLAQFGSPGAVLAAEPAALEAVGGAAVAAALADDSPEWPAHLDRCLRWLDGASPQRPRRVLTLGDAAYPHRWLDSPDPPLLVFAEGRVELASRDAVAVVGSRHPTPQGVENARQFARELGEQGWTVVSGLALGIDAAAHEGALDTAGGTVGVVGCGPDIVYPARHRALYERIMAQGLLLSEFAPGTPPRPAHFPQRNRLIAALARGTLVVEAALQSGSLVTARLALEVGADVFAIPGSIHSPQSKGCHALIQQGARLVECAADVIEELNALPGLSRAPPAPPAAASNAGPAGGPRRRSRPVRAPGQGSDSLPLDWAASDDERAPDPSAPSPGAGCDPEAGGSAAGGQAALLDALGYEPVSLDALSARTGWSAAALGVQLLELELDGRVRRLPGQLFQRCGSA